MVPKWEFLVNSLICTFFTWKWKYKWLPNVVQKLNAWGKSGSWVIFQKPLHQSECRIFQLQCLPNSLGMNLNFYLWSSINNSYKFTESFQGEVVRHTFAFLKLCQIVSQLYHKSDRTNNVVFTSGYWFKEVTNLFNHFEWVWSGMPKFSESNELAISVKWT